MVLIIINVFHVFQDISFKVHYVQLPVLPILIKIQYHIHVVVALNLCVVHVQILEQHLAQPAIHQVIYKMDNVFKVVLIANGVNI